MARGQLDEVAHAIDAYGIAGALRGTTAEPLPLDVDDAPAPAAGFRGFVQDTWEAGCLAETAATARAALDVADASRTLATTHPLRRRVLAALSRVAQDETRHAALAWRSLKWAVATDAAANATLAECLARPSDGSQLQEALLRPAARSILARASPPAFRVAAEHRPLADAIRAALLRED